MAAPYYLANGSHKILGNWVTWFQYNSGTSGPGTAYGQYRGPGDPALSSPVQFVDSTGTPLSIQDGGMSNVEVADNGPLYYTFTPIIQGETAVSVWYSSDNMVTWHRIA